MAKRKHLSESRTEDIVMDLLKIQGWQDTSRPPKGWVVRKNEYKDFPSLENIFKGRSKSGAGDAYPDFLIVDQATLRPLAVIETKASEKDFSQAVEEACQTYGEACRQAGHSVLAIGVAGQEKDASIRVGCHKYLHGGWEPVSYLNKPIFWLPTPTDLALLLSTASLMDLNPVVPGPDILAEKAECINSRLREASVKDEYRPAYLGAMMLALWQSKGNIRRDPENVLADINAACKKAFERAGKADLATSLHIDEANGKLAETAWLMLATLDKLNVATASFAHDYLGQLYEAFFRYTGGNTIGQYFTPRHITRFMADLCETTPDDRVIDPACGTGGFLIACIQRAENTGVKYEEVIRMVRDKLIGYESEPVTAALCVANMILRGDGTTGIRRANSLSAADYPTDCQVALMNPPFPHKTTDVPPQKFVERALEALTVRGKLAVILPTSFLVKKELQPWRKKTLAQNSLLAVCQLPDEVFQPYASATTSIVMLEKGVPHNPKQKTVFARLQYDGLTLKKSARVNRSDGKNEIPAAEDAILNKKTEPGFSGTANISDISEWSPGAYIPSATPTPEELRSSVDELLRRLASFYIRYAAEVATLRQKVASGEIQAVAYREAITAAKVKNAATLTGKTATIGEWFEIYYGSKELHSRENIPPGDILVVSPTEKYNGCYGWLSADSPGKKFPVIAPPFVTVAQTGTIGEAFVQLEPCGVNDDCLLLLPRPDKNLPLSCLFIAAAIIRLERWRFSYGRKLTPSRICDFPMPRLPELEAWAETQIAVWLEICASAIHVYHSATTNQSAGDTKRLEQGGEAARKKSENSELPGLFAPENES